MWPFNLTHFTAQYGPFRTLKWLTLRAKMGHIAKQLQWYGVHVAYNAHAIWHKPARYPMDYVCRKRLWHVGTHSLCVRSSSNVIHQRRGINKA